MDNFNNSTIYFGDLIEIKNGTNTPYKKNECLLYRVETDRFYSLEKTFGLFLYLEEQKNPTDEQKEFYYKEIKKYEYPYISIGQEGEIYVDRSSIKILGNGDTNGNTRRK